MMNLWKMKRLMLKVPENIAMQTYSRQLYTFLKYLHHTYDSYIDYIYSPLL